LAQIQRWSPQKHPPKLGPNRSTTQKGKGTGLDQTLLSTPWKVQGKHRWVSYYKLGQGPRHGLEGKPKTVNGTIKNLRWVQFTKGKRIDDTTFVAVGLNETICGVPTQVRFHFNQVRAVLLQAPPRKKVDRRKRLLPNTIPPKPWGVPQQQKPCCHSPRAPFGGNLRRCPGVNGLAEVQIQRLHKRDSNRQPNTRGDCKSRQKTVPSQGKKKDRKRERSGDEPIFDSKRSIKPAMQKNDRHNKGK